jgi:hypothetical protein
LNEKFLEMKYAKKIFRTALIMIASSIMLASCEATIKVPKHPAPGEPPPPPPRVEVNR